MRRALAGLILLLPVFVIHGEPEKPFPLPFDTEKGKPMSPAEALKRLRLPEGFQATLFAAEPDVAQPVAMTTDSRGRLWVTECYTYAESKTNYESKLRDRIVILEDTDHDGKADKRTVFWDQGRRTTSVAVGFGGAFVLDAPNLLFIPMQDDKPSGPPQVLLEGFNDFSIRHNIANGLAWGPDGWLYGRHGITSTSLIGKPGDPKESRTPMNCGIWRYHPTRKVFKPVCWGTTNPWGHDWDEHGELFFINTVTGHLWHGIPGAHFKRMFGEDLNKYTYGLIDQHADHFHWDAGKNWTDSREGKGKHGELGGGHAHSGCMIYQGDNWPAKYRGGLFTLNFHGRRINHDKLEQRGCGYVGKHDADMVFSDDPWFRGVELLSGNDGGVYIADWSDTGECHENDGVHRSSGRIYKVTYGTPKKPEVADLAKLSDEKLVELLAHKNVWYARKAQQTLQERAAAKQDMTATVKSLDQRFKVERDEVQKLRLLWALNASGPHDGEFLRSLLVDEREHVRVWAVRLLVDYGAPSKVTIPEFLRLADRETSPLVRLYLAAALQRLPMDWRLHLARRLSQDQSASDHNFPLMLWYGVEALVPVLPDEAINLAVASKTPLVRQYIARRLTSDLDTKPEPVNLLVSKLPDLPAKDALDVITGMGEALRGVRRAKAPATWARAQEVLAKAALPALTGKVRELGVVFGDGRALTEMRAIAQDDKQDGTARRDALRSLIESGDKETPALLKKLIGDRTVGGAAIRGLAAFDDPEGVALLLTRYRGLPADMKPDALATLTARPASAKALLQAIAEGKIPRGDVTAAHARQIVSLKDAALEKELTRVWGSMRSTSADKQKLIEAAKKLLTKERLAKADQGIGRAAFNQVCASCHKLYGEGQPIAPDLTGGNRHDLGYLLENIYDPSALVPADFRITTLTLKSGRVLNGVVTEAGPKTLAVQLPTEKVVIQKDEVEESSPTTQSLMPDNSLTPLKEEQVVALFAYLMGRQQVPLPGK